jgi:hypothetical protein
MITLEEHDVLVDISPNKFLLGSFFYMRICEDMQIKGSSKDLIKFAENYVKAEKEVVII